MKTLTKFIKFIWFAVKIAAIGYALWWLLQRPGTLNVEIQDWAIEASIGFTLVCLTILVAITATVYHWWRQLISLPKVYRDYRKSQQREKGFQAVTQGLLAVAAGDQVTANKQAKRASVLLEGKPLTKLLNAQTALMKGDEATAKQHFNALLEDPDGSFFGVRGLLSRALKNDDHLEALTMARKAYDQYPKQPWIIQTLFNLEARAQNWETAQELLKKGVKHDAFTKPQANRHESALLVSMANRLSNTDEALKLTSKAHKLSPDFTPVIAQLAQLNITSNKPKAAEKLIKTAWAKTPHPDLAKIWRNMSKNKLPLDQVKWAEKLIEKNRDHPQSRLLLSQAAFKAGLWGVARTELNASLSNAPTEKVYQLLAKLEQKEHGDDAAARQWLEKMADAQPAPQWVCQNTGTAFDEWTVLSPADGSFNSLEWGVVSHNSTNGTHIDTSNQNILPPSILDTQSTI